MDGIIDTVSAAHPLLPLIDLLKNNGKLVMVGVPDRPIELPVFPLILGKWPISLLLYSDNILIVILGCVAVHFGDHECPLDGYDMLAPRNCSIDFFESMLSTNGHSLRLRLGHFFFFKWFPVLSSKPCPLAALRICWYLKMCLVSAISCNSLSANSWSYLPHVTRLWLTFPIQQVILIAWTAS